MTAASLGAVPAPDRERSGDRSSGDGNGAGDGDDANGAGALAVAWLDAAEQEAWRSLLAVVNLLFDRLDRELRDAAGLTLEDYEVLVHLSEADDRRLRMSELAEHVLRSRSRLTYRVDQLERRGLVRRERCPDDGRGLFAALTPAGVQVLVAAAPVHVGGVRAHLVDVMGRRRFLDAGAGLADVAEALRAGSDRADRSSRPG